jgi:hypothetical protein
MQVEDLVVAASWATVLANVVATIFVGMQVRHMTSGLTQSRMQNQHVLCLEIWKQYNEAFSDRQWLMENPLSLDVLKERYRTSDAIFNSDEYKRLRKVASVYGMAASLIKTGAIDRDVIFNYISIPPKLWQDHWPFIRYIRAEHYENLFVGWEELNDSQGNRWKSRSRAELKPN